MNNSSLVLTAALATGSVVMAQPLDHSSKARPIATPQPTTAPTVESQDARSASGCSVGDGAYPEIVPGLVKVDGQTPVLNSVTNTLDVLPGQVLAFSVEGASDTA